MVELAYKYSPFLIAVLAVLIVERRSFWKWIKKPKDFDLLDSLDMGWREKLSLRLWILEGKYGRDDGWFVEYDGRRVALLTEPCFVDMFWESYQITPLSENPGERADMMTLNDFWRFPDPPLVYVSRGFGLRAKLAFASGLTGPGRVAVRGLYLPVRCSFLTRLILWLRKPFSATPPPPWW